MRTSSQESQRGIVARLQERPLAVATVAVAIAAAVLVVVAWIAGWHAVGTAFADFHPAWIALCIGGQAAAIASYIPALRSTTAVGDLPPLTLPAATRVVLAGFGPHALGGGFAIDDRVLEEAGAEPREAMHRVIGLGALEYVVLAPAACISAIVLLVVGSSVQASLLWPWALAVPIGFALGFWAAAPSRRRRVPEAGRLRTGLRRALEGVGVVLVLIRHPLRHAGAWLGMAGYWIAEIATLYGALRLFGVSLNVAQVILASATGYVATRRTLPLGGAGAVEALMSAAFVWVGLPLARAVPAVAAYRLVNVALPLLPAARAQRRLDRTAPATEGEPVLRA